MSHPVLLGRGEHDTRGESRGRLFGTSGTTIESTAFRPLIEYEGERVLLDIENMPVGRGVAFELDNKHLVGIKRASGRVDFYEIPSRK